MLLPRPEHGAIAVRPPGTGPGYWAGAPCAAACDGELFLAYRLRRPAGQGRGYAPMAYRSTWAAACVTWTWCRCRTGSTGCTTS